MTLTSRAYGRDPSWAFQISGSRCRGKHFFQVRLWVRWIQAATDLLKKHIAASKARTLAWHPIKKESARRTHATLSRPLPARSTWSTIASMIKYLSNRSLAAVRLMPEVVELIWNCGQIPKHMQKLRPLKKLARLASWTFYPIVWKSPPIRVKDWLRISKASTRAKATPKFQSGTFERTTYLRPTQTKANFLSASQRWWKRQTAHYSFKRPPTRI